MAGLVLQGGQQRVEMVLVWLSVQRSVVLELEAQREMRTGQILGSVGTCWCYGEVQSVPGARGLRQENQ